MIWASYAALLGYIGGKSFEDNHTLAFVVAWCGVTTAVSISLLIEPIRHLPTGKPAGGKRRGEETEVHDDVACPALQDRRRIQIDSISAPSENVSQSSGLPVS